MRYVEQDPVQQRLHLGGAEGHADALVRATAERHVREAVLLVLAAGLVEARRVEGAGAAQMVRDGCGGPRADGDHRPGGHEAARRSRCPWSPGGRTPGTGVTSRIASMKTRSSVSSFSVPAEVDRAVAEAQRLGRPRSCHSGCLARNQHIAVAVIVEVSWAAIIRKIMWLTMSSSLNDWPVLGLTWQSAAKRSWSSEARFAGIAARK